MEPAPPAGGIDWDAQVGRIDDLCDTAPATCVEDATWLIAAARAEGRQDVEARLLYLRGFAHHLLSDDGRALASMTRALEIAMATGDRAWEGRVRQGLASAHNGFGDNSSAIDFLEQSLSIRRELGEAAGLAAVLNNLADTYLSMRQFPERARALLDEALTLWELLDHRDGRVATLTNLATLDMQESERLVASDPALARHLAEHAVEVVLRATTGPGPAPSSRLAIEAEITLARALMACDRLAEARDVLDALGGVLADIEVPYLTIRFLGARGQLERLAGHPADAIEQLTAGIQLSRSSLRRLERTALLAELVLVHEGTGDFRAALRAHREYHAAVLEERDEVAERRANVINARLEVEQARTATAAARLRNVQLETLNASLAHDAVHDPLTGLVNRRGFDTALASRLHDDVPLACVVLDLDRFKSVNDEHSHAVGDEVLRRFARLMEAAIRVGDVAARTGGEEFILLLVGVSTDQARDVCDRLRDAVATYAWDEIAPGLSVTTSIGGTMRITGETGAQLVARADAQLYVAKRAGRDQVHFWAEEPASPAPTSERPEPTSERPEPTGERPAPTSERPGPGDGIVRPQEA